MDDTKNEKLKFYKDQISKFFNHKFEDEKVQNLVKIDKLGIPPPFGFYNGGNQCHLLAALQCLLTCTALYGEFISMVKRKVTLIPNNDNKNAPTMMSNLSCVYYKIISNRHNDHDYVKNLVNPSKNRVYDTMLVEGKKISNEYETTGQTMDAAEDITVIMSALGYYNKIKELFTTRFREMYFCKKCLISKDVVSESNVAEHYPYIQIYNSSIFKSTVENNKKIFTPVSNLSNTIMRSLDATIDKTCINKDVNGVKCGGKDAIYIRKLISLPSILCIQLGRSGISNDDEFSNALKDQKIKDLYQNILELCIAGKKYKYVLVAQIEYGPGHYWAKCMRNVNNKVSSYMLNDGSAYTSADTSLGITEHTVMMFYHFFKSE